MYGRAELDPLYKCYAQTATRSQSQVRHRKAYLARLLPPTPFIGARKLLRRKFLPPARKVISRQLWSALGKLSDRVWPDYNPFEER
jgi:hypothetical protein